MLPLGFRRLHQRPVGDASACLQDISGPPRLEADGGNGQPDPRERYLPGFPVDLLPAAIGVSICDPSDDTSMSTNPASRVPQSALQLKPSLDTASPEPTAAGTKNAAAFTH